MVQLTRSVDLRVKWWPRVEAHLSPATKREELERAVATLTDTYAITYLG